MTAKAVEVADVARGISDSGIERARPKVRKPYMSL
jgi:hypothetical protein